MLQCKIRPFVLKLLLQKFSIPDITLLSIQVFNNCKPAIYENATRNKGKSRKKKESHKGF